MVGGDVEPLNDEELKFYVDQTIKLLFNKPCATVDWRWFEDNSLYEDLCGEDYTAIMLIVRTFFEQFEATIRRNGNNCQVHPFCVEYIFEEPVGPEAGFYFVPDYKINVRHGHFFPIAMKKFEAWYCRKPWKFVHPKP